MLSMCRFVFLFSFFPLLFQSFCFAEECKGASCFSENASGIAAKGSRIEIPSSAEFKIEYDKSIIKISFSSGVLFADHVFLSGVKTLEFRNSRKISFCSLIIRQDVEDKIGFSQLLRVASAFLIFPDEEIGDNIVIENAGIVLMERIQCITVSAAKGSFCPINLNIFTAAVVAFEFKRLHTP